MALSGILDELKWYKKLEILRITKGWTQEEAATKCGTNQKVYWAWEKGLTFPRNNSRKAIARAFGVPVEDIFGRELA